MISSNYAIRAVINITQADCPNSGNPSVLSHGPFPSSPSMSDILTPTAINS